MTATQYAKNEIINGRFPSMQVVPGEFGTFWLESADCRTLDGACFTSREAAEKARSKALDKAAKFIA
jgi:hypothetical protein